MSNYPIYLFIVIYLDWAGQLQFNMYSTLAPSILKYIGGVNYRLWQREVKICDISHYMNIYCYSFGEVQIMISM